MKKILGCQNCGAHLTGPLMIVSGKAPDAIIPEHMDAQPLTEVGVAFKSYEPIELSYGDRPALLEFAPQYWLNPDDLTDAVRLTKNAGRLNGCCGLDGCDGPNQLCRCGVEVGTLRTDCWTPRVFIPAPDATHWIEEQ